MADYHFAGPQTDMRSTRLWCNVYNTVRSCTIPFGDHDRRHAAGTPLPKPAPARLRASTTELSFDLKARDSIAQIADEDGTVLYLAYGSNLCYATFQGSRGIKPLAQVNVVVPDLRMTFDLAGLPYAEPCFANSSRRNVEQELSSAAPSKLEKEFGPTPQDYHKDRWKKGMVGVVYEVTPADFAHIIATEGGGSAYQDIVVTCYALPDGVDSVPEEPSGGTAFRAHTLFLPPPPSPGPGYSPAESVHRPDPSYAQPSARYLKLISDGADEHALPAEYKDYIHSIRPYTITTQAQRLGQFVFLGIWMPWVFFMINLARLFQDEHGRSPKWLIFLSNAVFNSMWRSYDAFFRPLFGDGERTLYKDREDEAGVPGRQRTHDEELGDAKSQGIKSLLD